MIAVSMAYFVKFPSDWLIPFAGVFSRGLMFVFRLGCWRERSPMSKGAEWNSDSVPSISSIFVSTSPFGCRRLVS